MIHTGRLEPAPGGNGGRAGASARTTVTRNGVTSDAGGGTHVHFDVAAGDVVYHSTAGAGGYGDPHERPAELVVADVKSDLLSQQSAEEIYGIAFEKGAPRSKRRSAS